MFKRIRGEVAGLLVIAAIAAGFAYFIRGENQLPVWLGAILLAPLSLYFWHKHQCTAREWIGMAIGSVFAGALFFGVDVLVGSHLHPELPPLKAAWTSGGPFGILATLIVCPGLTIISLGGIVRQYFSPADNEPLLAKRLGDAD